MDGTDLGPRVRALCDLNVADAREASGRHEYDGVVQDLSPAGVRAGLAALRAAGQAAPAEPDPYDEAHLAAFEANAGVVYEQLELYRSNPLQHLGEMDLACYDRDYAPQDQRDAARTAHLRRWPEAAEHAIEALDRLGKPIAGSLVNPVRGLSAGIPATTEPAIRDAALAAHARLTAHIERAAASGAGPAHAPAGRGQRPDRRQPPGPGRGPRTGPRPPGRGRGDRGGPGLDPAVDRLHPREEPGALLRRRMPGRPGPGVAALGGGHDVVERAGRARGPVLVPHHSPGRVVAGRRGRGL